ncbi:LOW QUALITY PROTEIN: cingulin [Polypterus senegalus]|uniref:LOW QUALITY PROTEIN: cingulin n=1 Tax=Polypterus senegalus TaxID=55291 RepID=UPI001965EC85|nr:LOW QUALITY PROTEIN: cingulin [Polypterus senegalus]
MAASLNGSMTERQPPLDYGVQIRFINDLKESSKSKKVTRTSGSSSSYGVAVRVQGIDGQPYVVLKGGDKGDSYGVQLKVVNSHWPILIVVQRALISPTVASQKRSIVSGSNTDSFPENPYPVDQKLPVQHSRSSSLYSTSDDELSKVKPQPVQYNNEEHIYDAKGLRRTSPRTAGSSPVSSQGDYKSGSQHKPTTDVLRRSQSQGSLLESPADSSFNRRSNNIWSSDGYEKSPHKSVLPEDQRRSLQTSSVMSFSENHGNSFQEQRNYSGRDRSEGGSHWSSDSSSYSSLNSRRTPSNAALSPTPVSQADHLKSAGGSSIDTNPMAPVNSLISKFNSSSSGGQQPRGRTGVRSRFSTDERKRSRSLDNRLSSRESSFEESTIQSSLDRVDFRTPPQSPGNQAPNNMASFTSVYSSSSLGRPTKQTVVSNTRVTSSFNSSTVNNNWQDDQRAIEPFVETQRVSSMKSEMQQLKSTPDLLRDQKQVSGLCGEEEQAKQVIFNILREGNNENENSVKRKVNLVFEKIQGLKNTSPCSENQSAALQKDNLEKKVLELQRQLNVERKSRQNSTGQNEAKLHADLEDSRDKIVELQELMNRNKNELQSSVAELMQVRMEKEAVETRVRELEDNLSALQEEMRQDNSLQADKDVLETELMQLQAELAEMSSAKKKYEDLLHQRERELTALKGALKDEVATHDREIDQLRQQYQMDMEQLRNNFPRTVSGGVLKLSSPITNTQLNVETERQKINTTVRNLQKQLEESQDEISHWKEIFQKTKEELRNAKQDLLQARLDKEEFEEELRDMQERFSSMQVEVDRVKSTAVDSTEANNLRKDLKRCKEELQLVLSDKQDQELQVTQLRREITVLGGKLRDQEEGHCREMERLRQQSLREKDQLTKAFDNATKDQLDNHRDTTEQALRGLEGRLKEALEQNDTLKLKISSLELKISEYQDTTEEMEEAEARLKDKVARLEAERQHLQHSLGESSESEQELALVKRSLETRMDEAQRSLVRLTQEKQELEDRLQEELRQREFLKRGKSEMEEQKRLLDKAVEKLNKELDQMTAQSNQAVALIQSQFDEYRDKSRRELLDAQRQAKDSVSELERLQMTVRRLQEEITKLKHELQECQEEKDNANLDKELLTNRLQHVEAEIKSNQHTKDDRSRQIKILEDKLKHMELELDEERNTVELMTERDTRSRNQIDQLRAELMQERASKQDLECDKISLERQNKDLKARLSSLEGVQKPNASFSQLEARIQELDDRLQGEEREKNALQSTNRKLDRRIKELTIQLDDERQQYNDQKDQLSLRIKALKRQVDESEEEIERLENAKKKALRDLEDQTEVREQLQNRLKALEKETWRKNQRPNLDSSKLLVDDLSSDEDYDSAYGPSSIASLLTESNLQTSSC